jgi:hypothetical protein
MRFVVFTAVNFILFISWTMTPYSLVSQHSFGGRYCVHLQTKIIILRMQTTLVPTHKTTWRHNTENYTYELNFRKVKCEALCLSKHYAKRIYAGVEIKLHAFLTQEVAELSPCKETRYSFDKRLGEWHSRYASSCR